jgi:hypothetical protein
MLTTLLKSNCHVFTIQYMAKVYDYDWVHKGPLSSPDDTPMRFTKPLEIGSMFADLRNGRTYNVLAISKKVKEPGSFKPKETVQTSDAKPISEEQLTALRDSHKYKEDPDWPYLILSSLPAPSKP